jgi:hypothetical protein
VEKVESENRKLRSDLLKLQQENESLKNQPTKVIYRESDKDNENYFREKSTKLENELKLAKNDELKLRYEMDQQVKVIKSDEFKLRLGLESELKFLKSDLQLAQTTLKSSSDLLSKPPSPNPKPNTQNSQQH